MNASVQKSLNLSVSEKTPSHQLIQQAKILAVTADLFENKPSSEYLEWLALDCTEFLRLTFSQANLSLTGGKV